MFTFTSSRGTVFQYNTDLSGYVNVIIGDETFQIPGWDILEFVAYGYVQPVRVERISDMDYRKILLGDGDG